MANVIRFHRKTKTGCTGCKLRRVKCDETRPQCASCTRRGEECSYTSTSASGGTETRRLATIDDDNGPSKGQVNPPQITASAEQRAKSFGPEAKHLLDLQLMHQYCIFTAEFFAAEFHPGIASILKVDLPQLAYSHEVLMNAILFVAIIHLVCTDSELSHTLPVHIYREQALRSLRQEIGNMTELTVSAVRGASVLLATVSFASDRVSQQSGLWVMNWLTLALGRRNICTFSLQSTTSSASSKQGNSTADLYGSFYDDLPSSAPIASGIFRAMEMDRTLSDTADSDILYKTATEISRLIVALESPREQAWVVKRIKGWAFDVVEARFLNMLRQEKPCALVILAHYLALFSLLPCTWLNDGLVVHDMGIIADKLGSNWEDCIVMPKMVLEVRDQKEITEMLLSSLL